MSEYNTIIGQVLSVEEVQSAKGHHRWVTTVVTNNGVSLKIWVTDWDDTGVCPLRIGETQQITYKDWVSNQGAVYHNYVAPRKNNNGASNNSSSTASGGNSLRMRISRIIGGYTYQVEVEGAMTQATAVATAAQQAIQALTQNAIQPVAQGPEEEVPPF